MFVVAFLSVVAIGWRCCVFVGIVVCRFVYLVSLVVFACCWLSSCMFVVGLLLVVIDVWCM